MNINDYISQQAYLNWIDRGCGHGNDFDDWLHAEQKSPTKAVLGWKPLRIEKNISSRSEFTPCLVNWRDYLLGNRKCYFDTNYLKMFWSVAWINEQDSMHSDGNPILSKNQITFSRGLPPDDELFLHPFPFTNPENLIEKNSYIEFHGIALIKWIISLKCNTIQSIDFEFQNHPSTVCHIVSKELTPLKRLPSYSIHDFQKGMSWENSVFQL